MFFTIGLIIYLPLVLYVIFRIRNLMADDRFKNHFSLFFILLTLAFPVAHLLSHNTGSSWAKYLMVPGYYALPFLLYLFLLLLLSDIIIGLCRMLRIVPKETIRSPRFRHIRLGVLLILPVLIVIIGIVNYRYIRINEYTIEVPRKSSKLSRLKIAFAADFHLKDMTDYPFVEEFVAKVNGTNPDIVLIGGDLLEGDRQDEASEEFADQFHRIKAKYGVYAVLGNHEMHGGGKKDFFNNSGIHLLQDTVEQIQGAFYLAGRIDGRAMDRKSIDDLLHDTPGNLPVILLDHRPTDLDGVSQSIVDVQLSGHTHNGQLFPFNWITNGIYELSWGHKKIGHTHFFVTSGIRVWGPPVRTTGVSEIVVINVVFRDAQ